MYIIRTRVIMYIILCIFCTQYNIDVLRREKYIVQNESEKKIIYLYVPIQTTIT